MLTYMCRLLLISLFLVSTTIADTWTVDDDGKADFDNIQAAIDASSNGDEIVVMPGTYTGSGSYVVNMNGKQVLLRSQEGPQSTIVSGQNQRNVFFCGNNETVSTIISGFTITEGSGSQGGGIRCLVSSPRIENCHIINNYAGQGGGFASLGSGPDLGEIVNCVFKNNEAYFGGAIFSDMGNFWVIDCLIRDNVANIIGGVYVYCCSVGLQSTVVCSNANGQTYGTYEDSECLISETCESCGDINGDDIVNVGDLLLVIKNWNTSNIDGDVTLDGIVDVEDILFIVSAWGNDCSPPPSGACCVDDWENPYCIGGITEEECYSYGGWYQGDGTDCDSVSCF